MVPELRVCNQVSSISCTTLMFVELVYSSLLMAVPLGIAWAAGYVVYTLYRRPQAETPPDTRPQTRPKKVTASPHGR